MRLYPEGDWSADVDAVVVYCPLQAFPSSAWDWIGLFKVIQKLASVRDSSWILERQVLMGLFCIACAPQVGFSSVSDYITYTWVKDDEVAVNEELVQVWAQQRDVPHGLMHVVIVGY